MDPVAYLPIEIKYREMPSRLMIAAHLLGAGYTVIVGSHWALIDPANQKALPPGLFLFKSMNRIQGNAMAMLRGNGHMIAGTDEEVLQFIDDPGYMAAFSEIAANSCTLFFAQSEAHRQAVERYFPQLKDKVRIAGNVRVDLMSPENRTLFEALDARVAPLKPYILFNTNYGLVNSVWADSNRTTAMAEATGMFDGPDRAQKVREYQAFLAWEAANNRAMVALIQWVVNNGKGLNFVLRPHPSERPRYWEQVLAPVPRAHIIARSDPHPWILGAELVIHTGCTTGLETVLLDKPAVNLLPSSHPNWRQIVELVNPTFRTWEEAAKAIAQYFGGRQGPIANHGPQAAAALAAHLPSYRDNAAARLIGQGLAAMLADNGARPGGAVTWRGAFRAVELAEIQRDKYSATAEEVDAGLRKAMGAAGVSAPFRLAPLGEGLFLAAPN